MKRNDIFTFIIRIIDEGSKPVSVGREEDNSMRIEFDDGKQIFFSSQALESNGIEVSDCPNQEDLRPPTAADFIDLAKAEYATKHHIRGHDNESLGETITYVFYNHENDETAIMNYLTLYLFNDGKILVEE